MNLQTRRLSLATLLCGAVFAAAAQTTGPYDETADAKQQIEQALADAAQARVPLLVVFGANWCGDCKVLDLAFKTGSVAPLMAQRFRVVKVNVGRFDRNTDIAARYGVPLKAGIPAVALLSTTGQVVYASQAGELADARTMGDAGIHQFFTKLANQAR